MVTRVSDRSVIVCLAREDKPKFHEVKTQCRKEHGSAQCNHSSFSRPPNLISCCLISIYTIQNT